MGTFNAFTRPFVSLHVVIAEALTIGIGLGYWTDFKIEEAGYKVRTDLTEVLVAPRFGYVIDIDRTVSIWLRAGLTYASDALAQIANCPPTDDVCAISSSKTTTLTRFDLSLDPLVVFTPFPHVGFLVGPVADIALSGKQTESNDSTSADRNYKLSSFGIAAGFAVLF